MALSDFTVFENNDTVTVDTTIPTSEGLAACEIGDECAIVSDKSVSEVSNPQQIEFSGYKKATGSGDSYVGVLFFLDPSNPSGYRLSIREEGVALITIIPSDPEGLFGFEGTFRGLSGDTSGIVLDKYQRYRATAFTDGSTNEFRLELDTGSGFNLIATFSITDPKYTSGGIGLASGNAGAFVDDIVIRY